MVAGFAISGIGADLSPASLSGHWRISSTRGNPHGLATAELAIQSEFAPRPIDLTLPSEAGGDAATSSNDEAGRNSRLRNLPLREAYNRSTWLHEAQLPRSSPVTPLGFLHGE
jgi:hypothetical protein